MQPLYQRYKATVRYVGAGFHGFQVQPGQRTVQGELCRALSELFGCPAKVTGCSRTDSGVHANEFVIRIDAERSSVPPEKLPVALAEKLPPDLALISAEECSEDFHPRYGVCGKQYLYRVRNCAVRDPFLYGRVWLFPRRIDDSGLDRMRRAARDFIGKHDFTSFMSSGSDTPDDTVRTVTAFSVEREGEEIRFTVRADGFLYNMVRIMVGTLLEIAQGKIPEDAIGAILAAKDRAKAGMTAPPEGLYLDRVFYPEIPEKR